MTRLTHLLTALGLAGVLAGATVAACGGTRTSPGEMTPLAPKPELLRPNAIPMTTASKKEARPTVAQGPYGPVFQAGGSDKLLGDQPTGAPADAGTSDSASAPLPPVPDGSVPADSRMEPILQRDGGR